MSSKQDTTASIQLAPSSSSTAITATTTTATTTRSSGTSSLYNTYHSQLDSLKRLPVPYGDLYHTLSAFDVTPVDAVGAIFRKAASDLSAWLETAEMTVYGLEMDVEQDGVSDGRDVGEIDVMMNRFQPNISMLVELKDKIRPKLLATAIDTSSSSEDDDVLIEAPMTEHELQETVQAVESSWSSLKAMVVKVKGILASIRTRGDHLTRMENVLGEIEEIGLKMDSFQEERARSTPDVGTPGSVRSPPSPTLSLSSTTTETMTVSSEVTQSKQRNTEVLTLLDSRIELLEPVIHSLNTEIEAQSAGDTEKDGLLDQFHQLTKLWIDLKARRERIGEEIKEERWLGVFDQVAGQVESMMESLDRAIIHCKGLIDQIKNMVKEKVIPTAPIDRDHLYTIFKSFEAKHKYYAPAVNKMLNMLENGIESRMTRNADVIQKHRTMKATWEQLRGSLDRVELDLNDIESMLDILDASIPSYLPTPPSQLPEKPLFSMRKPQTQADWKSPGPPALFQPSHQTQQPQRGRRPPPATTSTFQNPTQSSLRSRTRSPLNVAPPPPRRPWSPAPSVSSMSLLLSPNMNTNYRAHSRSPSPTLARANSDKPRPWCPRPVFSPAGSLSKLSSGAQSSPSMPALTETATDSTIAFGRKAQLKLPPPVITNSTRLRQNSAPGAARPQFRSASPMARNRDSSAATAATVTTTSSSRLPVYPTQGARLRRSSMQNGQSNQASADQPLNRHRRPSVGTTKSAASVYDIDHLDSAYGSVPGSAIGNGNPVFDEPASPSASSSSSVSSLSRATYTQQQQIRQSSKTSLPSMMKEMSINKPAPKPYVATRGDVLDDEFARIVNASPIQMQVRRLGEGKYYFGGKVEELSTGGYSAVGGKMVLCRLMEHGRPAANGTEEDSGVSSGGSHSGIEDAIQQQQLKQRQAIASRQAPAAVAAKTLRRPEPAAQRNTRTRATSTGSATSGKSRKVMVRIGDLSTQQLKVIILEQNGAINSSDDLQTHSSFAVHFDSELSEYHTRGGVHVHAQSSTTDKKDDGVVTAPVLMWVEALQRVFDNMKAAQFPFHRVVSISGAAQQHGSVYWSSDASRAFEALQAEHSSSSSLTEIFKNAFTVVESPIWQDTSTTVQCEEMELFLGNLERERLSHSTADSDVGGGNSKEEGEEWKSNVRLLGQQRLAELTGSRAYERYTGSQILKIVQETPEIYRSTVRISLVSSFLASLLVASFVAIDVADGSGMNLLDIRTKTWDTLLTAFIDRGGRADISSADEETRMRTTANSLTDKLGEVDATGKRIQGVLSSWFVDRYGFSSDVNVVTFTGDNPATVMALRAERGDAMVSLGTSDTLLLYTDTPPSAGGASGSLAWNEVGDAAAIDKGNRDSSAARLSVGYLCHPVDPNGYLMLYCAKNGSLAREQVRDLYADGNWDRFDSFLREGMEGYYDGKGDEDGVGEMNFGFYFFDREIWPPVHGVYRFGNRAAVDEFLGDRSGASGQQGNAESVKRGNVVAICESQFLAMRVRSSQGETSSSIVTAPLNPPGISRILATGGASSNRILLQLLANVFGVPVVSMGTDDQQPGAGSAAWGAARKAYLYGQGHRGQEAAIAGEERTRSNNNSYEVAILPDLVQTQKYVDRIPEFLRLEASLL
ncbi:hypothetical protein EC991_003560 [Linnemannia zychae]|nr:hypothetical protein EC991_003560 [Linnemannia zychae]